jgi:hypothetical protein
MKTFLSAASVLVLLLGAAWLFLPQTMLARWAVQTDATGLYLGRRYGASLLGYAAMLWLAARAGEAAGRSAVLIGAALVAGLLALVSLAGVVTGIVGPGAWASVVIEAVLAAGFVHLLVGRRAR